MDRDAVIALIALGFASFAIGTDVVGVGVVIVAVEREFNTTISTTQWVLSIFALTFAMLLVTGGRLADMFGRRRLLFFGLAIFGAAVLGCALAPNESWLIGARALQGVGAAIIWPCVMGIGVAVVPKEDSGFAIGLMMGAVGLGNVLGPIAAGVLNELATWRLFFILNLALVSVTATLAVRGIPPDQLSDQKERIDFTGIIILSSALFALLYALDQSDAWSWTSPAIIGLVTASAVLFAAFPFIESRVADPLVPPHLMQNREFVIALAENGFVVPAAFTTFIYLPQYAHKVLGWDVLHAAFSPLPMMVVMACFSPITGRFYKHLGPKRMILGGYCITVAAMVILARLEPAANYISIAIALVILALGLASTAGPAGTAAVDLVEPSQASLAGGLSFMVHLAMAAIGIAASTAIIVAVSKSKLADGLKAVGIELSPAQLADVNGILVSSESASQALTQFSSNEVAKIHAAVAEAFASGFHAAIWFCTGIAFIGCVAALFLPPKLERPDN